MKIAIIGTGAIGGFYGIMLANAGHDVHFLLRSDYGYVKENGLTLQSDVHGAITLKNVNAYASVNDMPRPDVILVALKTTQNGAILPKILAKLADANNMVVLVQNGLGMEEDLTAHLPHIQVAGGVALITSYKKGSGQVIHQDHGDLDMGSYNLREMNRLDDFVAELRGAGIAASNQRLDYLRWKKLVWNMSFNGLSVVLNSTTTEILSEPESLLRCKKIMHEVIAGAGACGVVLPEDFADKMIAFTHNLSTYSPSMKLDFDLSRQMEIEYLYAKPLAAAANAGYDMQETKKLYHELIERNGFI